MAEPERLPYWADISDPASSHHLRGPISRIVEVEAPMHIDVLHQRVRTAWGASNSCRRLMFGAAWKILDLVVEDSLGPLPPRPDGRPRYRQIKDKAEKVLTSHGAVKARKPFTRRNPEWTAAW